MAKIRYGFIGCGSIANMKHMPFMAKKTDDVELVAFCDLVPERAEKACKDYGAPGAKWYTDYRELLADPTIDAVSVLTPNVSHSEISVAALDAGKHVLCEKPMAATYADAKAMMDASIRNGKLLTIGYQYRHWNEHQLMKQYCVEEKLGEIYYAEATALRRRGVPTHGVFTDKSKQGGGPLIDCGTHALDLTLWMMDNYEPESVTGVSFEKLGRLLEPHEQGNGRNGSWDNKTYEVEDAAMGFIRMKNGAVINLRASWAINRIETNSLVTLCGTRGGLDSEDGVRFNHISCNKMAVTTSDVKDPQRRDFIDACGKEADHWVRALKGEGELYVKPEQALCVTRILDAIYESSHTGKTVYFD